MVGGALAGFTGAFVFNSIIMGFIFGMIAGAVLALVHGFLSISLKAQQPVSGIMLVLLGIGLTSFLGKPMSGRSIAKIGGFTIPLLNRIPILGPALFKQDILVYLSIALVPVTWFLLHRTRWGLSVIAAGENPGAADTLGINVVRVRYICVLLGGLLTGLGGAYLTLAYTPMWVDGMTAGRGRLLGSAASSGRCLSLRGD